MKQSFEYTACLRAVKHFVLCLGLGLAGAIALAEDQTTVSEGPARVLSPGPDSETFVITQDPNRKWKLGDRVCVSTNQAGQKCGEVIVLNAKDSLATVKLVKSPNLGPKKKKRAAAKKESLPRRGEKVTLVPAPISQPVVTTPPVESRKPTSQTSLTETTPVPPDVSPVRLRTGLGLAYDAYTESGHSNYSAFQLRLDAGAEFRVRPRIALLMNGYLTLTPLSKNQTASARTLGAGGQISYDVLNSNPSVMLTAVGGVFFRSMLVSSSAFGISGATGFELFPRLSVSLNTEQTLLLSARFCPLFGVLNAIGTNREIGVTAQWRRSFPSQRALTATIDYTHLAIATSGVTSSLGSLLLSVGIEW